MIPIPPRILVRLSSVLGILKKTYGSLCESGQTNQPPMISTPIERSACWYFFWNLFWIWFRSLTVLNITFTITWRQVLRSIKDNITEEVLLNEINEIIRLPMYADRIRSDSKAAANLTRRRWWAGTRLEKIIFTLTETEVSSSTTLPYRVYVSALHKRKSGVTKHFNTGW